MNVVSGIPQYQTEAKVHISHINAKTRSESIVIENHLKADLIDGETLLSKFSPQLVWQKP